MLVSLPIPITQHQLREILSYDPESGAFVWLVTRGKARKDAAAGFTRRDRYIEIGIDGALYFAHRLAWFYVHGRWPIQQIDHINGIRGDNRIANLREASNAQNLQNLRKASSNSKSGFLGVSLRKSRGKWRAEIVIEGRKKHLGYFDSSEEAYAAYLAAKVKFHPYQTITGVL